MKSYQPQIALGELFSDVIYAEIIDDEKWWADAIPLFPPDQIVSEYITLKNQQDFDLLSFINTRFDINGSTSKNNYKTVKGHTIDEHIMALWPILEKVDNNEQKNSTSICLPYPYIIPGGRFKEIYYWDSYFTMLGLRVHEKWDMIESMVKNFAWMIDQFGFIPNGSRSYYLSRSQPPFFSLMVELLAEHLGDQTYLQYLDAMVSEYKFFTQLNRTTTLGNNETFSRYFDASGEPRIEMYLSDIKLQHLASTNTTILSEIRAACESGWDFSSRWFDESEKLESIRTSKFIPVDLECLLWHLEQTISKAFQIMGDQNHYLLYLASAEKRKNRIQDYFWNDAKGFYCDFDIQYDSTSNVLSLAGMYPLFFGLINQKYADIALENLEKLFLKAGGLVTTLSDTGQQWDAPNGWAPLQWIGYNSALNYGHHDLAQKIKSRWMSLNEKIFNKTGKMLEKYNVENLELEGGGGEYPVQDGFGWTNGVYLALKYS